MAGHTSNSSTQEAEAEGSKSDECKASLDNIARPCHKSKTNIKRKDKKKKKRKHVIYHANTDTLERTKGHVYLFIFETGSHIVQAGLELPMQQIILNSCYSCLYLQVLGLQVCPATMSATQHHRCPLTQLLISKVYLKPFLGQPSLYYFFF